MKIKWNNGMQFAIVNVESNQCANQSATNQKVNPKFYYIIERSEMFDHSKPSLFEMYLKEKAAIELVHNCATESLGTESMANLESSLRVLASNRGIEIEIETAEEKAEKKLESDAKELCKLRCKSFGQIYHWCSIDESNKEGYREMIRAGVKLPSNG